MVTTSGAAIRRSRLLLWGGIGMLLLLPLVAMRVTDEVAWTPFDFLAAAVLLGSAGIACEVAVRTTRRASRRLAAIVAVLVVVALVWAHGAVGLF